VSKVPLNNARHLPNLDSAVGIITDDTARAFESFARGKNVRGARLVLDSEGGSVLSAMALGRTIRNFDMTTTVGRTEPLPEDGSGVLRAVITPDASCESMCAFVLLAGTRRYVPNQARVLVHQIWLGAKSKRARETTYTADELGWCNATSANWFAIPPKWAAAWN
jgi:hypothetical protein